jgi:hypothetical protein
MCDKSCRISSVDMVYDGIDSDAINCTGSQQLLDAIESGDLRSVIDVSIEYSGFCDNLTYMAYIHACRYSTPAIVEFLEDKLIFIPPGIITAVVSDNLKVVKYLANKASHLRYFRDGFMVACGFDKHEALNIFSRSKIGMKTVNFKHAAREAARANKIQMVKRLHNEYAVPGGAFIEGIACSDSMVILKYILDITDLESSTSTSKPSPTLARRYKHLRDKIIISAITVCIEYNASLCLQYMSKIPEIFLNERYGTCWVSHSCMLVNYNALKLAYNMNFSTASRMTEIIRLSTKIYISSPLSRKIFALNLSFANNCNNSQLIKKHQSMLDDGMNQFNISHAVYAACCCDNVVLLNDVLKKCTKIDIAQTGYCDKEICVMSNRKMKKSLSNHGMRTDTHYAMFGEDNDVCIDCKRLRDTSIRQDIVIPAICLAYGVSIKYKSIKCFDLLVKKTKRICIPAYNAWCLSLLIVLYGVENIFKKFIIQHGECASRALLKPIPQHNRHQLIKDEIYTMLYADKLLKNIEKKNKSKKNTNANANANANANTNDNANINNCNNIGLIKIKKSKTISKDNKHIDDAELLRKIELSYDIEDDLPPLISLSSI